MKYSCLGCALEIKILCSLAKQIIFTATGLHTQLSTHGFGHAAQGFLLKVLLSTLSFDLVINPFVFGGCFFCRCWVFSFTFVSCFLLHIASAALPLPEGKLLTH